MAVKINNIDYSGFFYNGEALTAMYLNGNKVFSKSVIPPIKYKTYRQVEWISNEDLANNNNYVWLNLGYQWNTKSKAVFEMQEVNYNGSQYWGTSGGVSDNGDMRFFRASGTLYMDVGSKRIQISNTKNSNFHVGECGNYYFTFNGSTKTGTTYTNTDTSAIQSPIGLFCSAKDSARFKYFQIYEDDELIMDIVPVLDENDIPMFLDKISGKEIAYMVDGHPSTGLTAGNATGSTIKIVYSESSVTISNSSTSGITVGNTFNLNASVVPTGSTLTYTSSNPSVASVDSNGVVSGIASGSTTITITASEYVDDENRIVYRSGTSTVNLTIEEASQPFNPLTDSKYFVIKALTGTTLSLNKKYSPSGSISYRKNGVGEWTTLSSDVALSQGDYLEMKGDYIGSTMYYRFSTSNANSIDVGGYIMALTKNDEIDDSNNTITQTAANKNGLFQYLFSGCTGVVNAENLKMSDNNIATIYKGLFRECTNLETAPVLSADLLANNCYTQMFRECTKLASLTVEFYDVSGVTTPLAGWLYNINTTGVLYAPSDAEYSASDILLPSTWTLSKTLSS